MLGAMAVGFLAQMRWRWEATALVVCAVLILVGVFGIGYGLGKPSGAILGFPELHVESA
ncbi:MAG TPA: hypothetical protein VGE45_16020 [Chloroflexia bacterium]